MRSAQLTLVGAATDDATRRERGLDWSKLMTLAQDGDRHAYRALLDDVTPYEGACANDCLIWDPEGKVDRGLKRLIAHVASRTAGCQYCMAHTAGDCTSASKTKSLLPFGGRTGGPRSLPSQGHQCRMPSLTKCSQPSALTGAKSRSSKSSAWLPCSAFSTVERHARDPAGRRADSYRPKVSRATRLVSREIDEPPQNPARESSESSVLFAPARGYS